MRTHAGLGWIGLLTAIVSGCAASQTHDGGNTAGYAGVSAGGNAGTASSDGGSTATGGASHTGGASTTGGSSHTGGASTTGGTANTGGSAATGGTSTGGTTNTGGSNTGGTSTGGTTNTGGTSTGGSTNTGGMTSTGGSGSTNCPAVTTPSGVPSLTPGTWKEITPAGVDVSTTYGFSRLAIDPCNPYTVYVAVDQRGMYKTTNGGGTWQRLGTPPSQPNYSNNVDYLDSPLDVKVDPADGQHLYSVQGVRGQTLGFWVSHDGGQTWTKPANFAAGEKTTWTNDAYWLSVDPTDFNHVLVTFHSPWKNTTDSGVVETTDGGGTWTPHIPGGWGAGLAVSFLYDPASGTGNSKTWLVGTQWGNGYYRTTDGGATWKNVTTQPMMHGGTGVFYAKNGVLYSGADRQIMRSTDNGVSWKLVGPTFNDGFYIVVGDGNNLYAQEANTGGNSVGPQPYITSPETDGVTWSAYNSQKFTDGPFDMEFDSTRRIIYSSNWKAGVWALAVQ